MLGDKKEMESYGGGGGAFSGPLLVSAYGQWSITYCTTREIVPRIMLWYIEP